MPKSAEPPPLVLAGFLPYRLSVLAEAVSRAFARTYEERFGITIPEWRVLAVLGERSPRSTRDVIALTQMDRVRVSRATLRLVARSLVAQRTRPNDQRAHDLLLTRQGRAIYRQIVPLADALQSVLLQGMDADAIRMFEAVIADVQSRADGLSLRPARAGARQA